MDYDVSVLGGVNIDTNVYLYDKDIDFSIEANFSQNIDMIGGTGAYLSSIFKEWGYDTNLIGVIGDDWLGKLIVSEVKSRNIDSYFMIDQLGTKRSINFMNLDGSRKNFYDGKGSMGMIPDKNEIIPSINKSKLVWLSIVDWSRHLIPHCLEVDKPIVTDLQDVISLDDPYRLDFVKAANYIFLSGTNLKDPEKAINHYRKINPKAIYIVGLGNKGCMVGFDNMIKQYSSIENDWPVLDTNGAGDSLAAGFISSHYFQNKSIDESVHYAQLAAKFTCSIKGRSNNFINKGLMGLE